MQLTKKRGLYEAARTVYLPISKILTNPDQHERIADSAEMRKLSESIAKYGVLQPLSVRRHESGYELLSGERRLRAAKIAGLNEVPCIVIDVNTRESAVLMLIEKLKRRDIDFIEQARGLSRLVNTYGYSQEEVARFVGLSQPAVANKLRLLKIPSDILYIIRDAGLSERHARALLRLEIESDIAAALGTVIAEEMTVAKTEEMIDNILSGRPQKVHLPLQRDEPKKTVFVINDTRLLVNSITRGVKLLRNSGVAVRLEQEETEKELTLTITIPK